MYTETVLCCLLYDIGIDPLYLLDAHVTVRIPVNDKLCRDISFSTTVPLGDFRDRVCAAMDLDPKETQIAWKSSDEPRRSRAHQLSTQAELNSAFQTLISLRYNPRRYREVVMEIVPLVSH